MNESTDAEFIAGLRRVEADLAAFTAGIVGNRSGEFNGIGTPRELTQADIDRGIAAVNARQQIPVVHCWCVPPGNVYLMAQSPCTYPDCQSRDQPDPTRP